MHRPVTALLGAVLLAGCAGTSAGTPTSTASPPTSPPTAHLPATARPIAAPTVVVDSVYRSFVTSICRAIASGDGKTVADSLMYYQYNSGLRWGMLGDGEGQTADPSLLTTWLAHARPHCLSFSPGTAGHGSVLTSGWSQPGPSSIIELDNINGRWKVNDFTFGSRAALAQAMQVGRPILPFHG